MSTPKTLPLPMCNASANGVQYYTPTPGQDLANGVGGFSGIVSSVMSSSMFTILGGVAYSSRGFDAITIVLLLLVISSSISIISNYISMTKKPDGYTENCQKNDRFLTPPASKTT